MNSSFALVTVRAASTRLPNKCLQNIINDITAIQVVIRRAKKIGCNVILATSVSSSDDPLIKIADSEGIKYFRGSEKNKIKRWADCFLECNINNAILVDGDDLTFDYNIAKRALKLLKNEKVEFVVSSKEMTPGFFTYGISSIGMEKLVKTAPNPNIDTDVITEFIKRANLSRSFVKATNDEKSGHNCRLTLDYEEDLMFYRKVYSRVNYLMPGPEIVKTILKYNLQRINWHKNEDFINNQQVFNQNVKEQII